MDHTQSTQAYADTNDTQLTAIKRWTIKNRDRLKAYKKEWYQKNREKQSRKGKEKYKANADYFKNRSREYRLNNKTKISQYFKRRRKEEPLFNFANQIRNLIAFSFRKRGEPKRSKTPFVIGCSLHELYERFERKFVEDMGWHNRQLWHIDHIVPVSVGRTEEEVLILNHHTNLRPMWGKDNITKRDNLPSQDELPPDLDPRVRALFDRALADSMQSEQ